MFFRYTYIFTLFLTTLLHVTTASTTTDNIRIEPSTSRFIDQYGRERIFHGINAVYKRAPYLPVAPADWVINQKVLTKFKSLGINVLRLGLMYVGAMPRKGWLNSTYFDSVETLVKLCQDNGIYTLLDAHQDLFSERFGGDGFPSWSLIQGNAKSFPYPYNETNLSWELYYMTEIVNSGFGYFYNNTDNLQYYYTQFWSESAKRFAKYSHMLGYELMNEPWPGDVFQDILIALPYKAYKQNLQPLYDTLSKEIWIQDPDHLVFFETITWDLECSGIEHVPGYAVNANKTVLSYHYYVPPQFFLNDTIFHKFRVRDKFSCGSMLTEFEAWNGETDDFKEVLKTADEWKESWIGWLSNPLALFSNSASFLSTFAHPYPQIVAGRISVMNFEPESNIFTLSYITNTKITSNETVIFVNKEMHYPNDFSINSTPTVGITIKRNDDNYHIIVYHNNNISNNGITVKITISPKTELNNL
ncbi:endoglycoceramidase-like [Oopsacas minuta]|uniref:Endoglycoceramidase-like n=1 Tax=Oopsacas minuta TaxID=111878 RepID=A0AAV7JTF8_9METZ|nr:endoglycoceramidase-like [Oopsacas minuta]